MNTALSQNTAEPGPARAAWLEAAALCAILGVLMVAYLWALGGPKFRLDDAYIVLNNAEALFAPDTNFPGTPALYGSTSLLHTLAAALVGLVLGMEPGLMVLAWVAFALYGIAVLELARDAGLSMALRLLIAATALTTGDFVQVYMNGLETGLAMAVIAWLIVLHRRGSRMLPILAALAPFVRPELILLSTLIMVEVVWQRSRAGEDGRALTPLIPFAALLGLMFAVQFWASGSLLPSTGSAKKYFFDTAPADPLLDAVIGTLDVTKFLAAMLPVSTFLLAIANGRHLPYVAFIGALLSYFILFQVTLIPQNFFRYLYVLIPFMVFGGTLWAASDRKSLRYAAITAFAVALVLNLFAAARTEPERLTTVREKFQALSQTARWINDHLVSDDVALIHDVGYVSFGTDQLFFDVVGLKSPEAVPINQRLTFRQGPAGRGRAIAEMAGNTSAGVLIVSTGFNEDDALTAPLEDLGWILTPHPAGNPPGHLAFLLSPPEE